MSHAQRCLSARATLLLLPMLLCDASRAFAQAQPGAAAKATARNLLIECRQELERKNLDAALKSCQGAHAIMGVPSTGLELANVLAAKGQLVEARETALDVTRFDNSTNNATFEQAKEDATTLARSLDKRIPSLVIHVIGPNKDAQAEVSVDGEQIPSAAVSLPLRVNPGTHSVVAASRGFEQQMQRIEVSEGQTKAVELRLQPVTTAGNKADVQDPWSQGQTSTPPDGPRRGVPTWAWISAGAGLVSAGAAVYFGLRYADARDTLHANCPDGRCLPGTSPSQAAQYQNDWNLALALTVTTSVLGAAGLGAGIYCIATSGKRESKSAVLAPFWAPNAGGLVAVGQF